MKKKSLVGDGFFAVDKFRHIPCGLELGWAAKLALALGVADEGAPFVVFFAPLESAASLCCLASGIMSLSLGKGFGQPRLPVLFLCLHSFSILSTSTG